MSEKIQNSFYLLKDAINVVKKGSAKTIVQPVDDVYIKKLMKSKGYKAQKVKPSLNVNYEISLYFRKTPTEIKWKDFIKSVAVDGEAILKHEETVNESYILILYSKKGKCYYSSTGGYGHMVIQDLATNDLGIEILSRIMRPEDKALRSTKERSLTGGILGSVKFFRNDYNLYENESFGNIYNELNAAVNRDKLINIFGFQPSEVKNDSLCIAKNSFSIKKSITFIQLLKIITKCEMLLSKPALVEINSVEKLGRGNAVLIRALNNMVNGKVYENYLDSDKFFSVEISHKDFERYYLSSYTIFAFRVNQQPHELKSDLPIREIQTLIDFIRGVDPALTQHDFDYITTSATITTYNESGEQITTDFFRNHYCTEVSYSGRSYFLIEKDWYEIGKTMIDKINENSKAFILSRLYTGPVMHNWKGVYNSENDYNASYIGKVDSMVFDKITPSNIEVCDVLRWDAANIYFYHVKKGFDNSMRDLCAQILIAARRVQEDQKDGYQFIAQLYDKLQSNLGTSVYIANAKAQLTSISKQAFIDLFIDRTPVFVLAVMDTAVANRSISTEIEKFDSNIAKFSLNELTKNMRNFEINFQILQVT